VRSHQVGEIATIEAGERGTVVDVDPENGDLIVKLSRWSAGFFVRLAKLRRLHHISPTPAEKGTE
jgi:hypothetical protein